LRIAHEALHNAVRHANADHVTVRLAGDPDKLVIEVSDDGIGFDPQAPDVRSRHLGLTSMEERARESQGRLRIRSAPGQGTTVRVELARDAH
jgi:signal transduction histidine kinase